MRCRMMKNRRMERYLQIRVERTSDQTEENTNKKITVEQILRRQAGFTKKQISRAKFHPEGIQKNGMRCRVTESVSPGDIIRVCVESDNEKSAHLEGGTGNIEILYEDSDLLAVNKPAGIVTHPQGGHYSDSLANQAASYFRAKGEEHSVRPVGRLDRETSGIVVFAKNKTAAYRLQKQREQKIFKKTYLAVVEGALPVDGIEHRIESPIGQDSNNRLKMCISAGGKEAVTHYKVLANASAYSLISVTLDTGRTHQIRVHMEGLGHPLAGDQLYGKKLQKEGPARACLHAWAVELRQPFTGEKIYLKAPVPDDMRCFTVKLPGRLRYK